MSTYGNGVQQDTTCWLEFILDPDGFWADFNAWFDAATWLDGEGFVRTEYEIVATGTFEDDILECAFDAP
jgi:hypothetical protein